MPLIKIDQINKNRAVALWNITESLEQLLAMRALSKYDRELYNKYTHDEKKREWLTGRLLLKSLAEEMNLHFNGVLRDENGKPCLIDHDAEVSLSHSYPYVAAIIDRKEQVGIDLEQPKEKLKKIAGRFLNAKELEFVGDDIKMLCICWCAKETLYKIYSQRGLAFREEMHIEPFELKESSLFNGNILANGSAKRYTLRYIVAADYILTFNE
ncbi:MAG: 4'-phosphopantetheinyl transferase superfamily protein [Bacteroidota bacterium]